MIDKYLLNNINWPCDLPVKTKQNLLSISEFKPHLSNGKVSFVKYYNRGVNYVIEGLATYSLISSEMKPLIGGVIGSGGWFGGMITHDFPEITLYTAEIEKMNVLFFPKCKVEKLAENDPNIFKFLYFIVQINQPRQFQTIIVSYYPVISRLAYCLLEISTHKAKVKGAIPVVKITQQQISDLTGVSRPRISEAINQLQNEQLISLSRGSISILNLKKLYDKLADLSLDFYDPYKELFYSND